MPEDFRIATVTLGRVTLLRVAGRLGRPVDPAVAGQVLGDAEAGRAAGAHLAEVSFVSSSGVGALLAIAERAHQAAGGLRTSLPARLPRLRALGQQLRGRPGVQPAGDAEEGDPSQGHGGDTEIFRHGGAPFASSRFCAGSNVISVTFPASVSGW